MIFNTKMYVSNIEVKLILPKKIQLKMRYITNKK